MASILTILGTFPPEAFDAIIPHGHRRSGGRVSVTNRIDYVALNPQPLPPREGFLVASAELAHEIGRLAVETDLVRGGGSDLVRELVDDWCGTGWPRRWPFPWPGPVPGTRTHELDVAGGHLAGAVVLASLGDRMPGTDLGAAFVEAAQKLAEVAQQG